MKNFAYRNSANQNNFFIPKNPSNVWPSQCPCKNEPEDNDRFGGFLLPFITGAVVSAPFWFVAGNNKNQQYQNQMAYQNQPYPMYYPYQPYPQNSPNQPYTPPSYFPYPPYR